jgi:hypothetical protein
LKNNAIPLRATLGAVFFIKNGILKLSTSQKFQKNRKKFRNRKNIFAKAIDKREKWVYNGLKDRTLPLSEFDFYEVFYNGNGTEEKG